MPRLTKEKTIRSLVHTAIETYAIGFKARHEGEVDNPNGTINIKIHNVFIAALRPEIQYYTALVRSLDSSLGNMLEKLAINIVALFLEVRRSNDREEYYENVGDGITDEMGEPLEYEEG